MRAYLHPRAARSLLLVGALAAACGTCDVGPQPPEGDGPVPREPESRVQRVELVTAPNANDTMAIEVDVLFVYDGQLADELVAAGAPAWFAARDRLLAEHNGRLHHVPWELVPGASKTVERAPEPADGTIVRVLVLANYVSGEPKLVDVSTMEHPRVYLCEQALALAPCRSR